MKALSIDVSRSSARGTPLIDVTNVTKTFSTPTGPVRALASVSLQIREGEFVSVVGRSGCGKSTLLNIVGGLIQPTAGSVSIGGHEVRGPDVAVGYVFQSPVLLRWRTVLENVLLPIEIQRGSVKEFRSRALELLDLVGLQGFEYLHPHRLSGGMQQRAALARSLIYDPSVLLMDEPFGALDAMTREQLNLELLRIWDRSRKTIIFVTHDISEAVFLSDRVIIMSDAPGQIREVVDVGLPRPRDLNSTFSPLFSDLRRHIRERLG